jgi:hypothetical protein
MIKLLNVSAIVLLLGLAGSGRAQSPKPTPYPAMAPIEQYRIADAKDEIALARTAGGPWLPHVMFFAPHGQAASWGAGLGESPILGGDSSELEFTVLYIPVPRWSDGSPATSSSTEHRHAP